MLKNYGISELELEKLLFNFSQKLNLINNFKAIKNSNLQSTIMLTGATGFLGTFILYSLIKNKNIKKIYCLIRSDKATSFNKICDNFNHYLSAPDSIIVLLRHKISLVESNLSTTNCGIDAGILADIKEQTTHILNLAGNLSAISNFKDLIASNIDPIINLVNLNIPNVKMFHASTLSVFVNSEVNYGTFFETELIPSNNLIFGGYAQTKYMSELLIQYIRKNYNIDISVIRYGLLTPEVTNVVFPKNDLLNNFLNNLVYNKVIIDHYDLKTAVDITPVDIASEITIDLMLNSKKSDIFHVANPNPTFLVDIVESIRANGIKLENLNGNEFNEALRYLPGVSKIVYTLAFNYSNSIKKYKKYSTFNLFKTTNCFYDLSNTANSLTSPYLLPLLSLNKEHILPYIKQKIKFVTK